MGGGREEDAGKLTVALGKFFLAFFGDLVSFFDLGMLDTIPTRLAAEATQPLPLVTLELNEVGVSTRGCGVETCEREAMVGDM